MSLTTYNKLIMKHYTIQYSEPLGKGSSGTVYKGFLNHQPMIPVAVKKLPISKRSLNEISIFKSLQNYASPQGTIPQLYHIGKTNNNYEIIMEYISGGSLTKWIEKNNILSEKKILHILRDVVCTLYLCHQKEILYGDLKPSNLIATQNILNSCPIDYTLVKTIDFGMSKNHPPKFFTDPFGTPSFMAPEVYNKKFSYPADIWALGICMYLLITGHYPFNLVNEGSNFIQKYHATVQLQEPKFNEPRWDLYSNDLQSLVRTMLNKNMFERPTAVDILNNSLLLPYEIIGFK